MNFQEYHNEAMKDPKFRKEYESLETEYTIKRAILKARKERNMTQEQLANETGIDRADISKLERGEANPTIASLERIAEGLGMKLKLEFVTK
ncbi:MAG: helix-turn-helix transcriptional regulator [Eubacteriales bacterium]